MLIPVLSLVVMRRGCALLKVRPQASTPAVDEAEGIEHLGKRHEQEIPQAFRLFIGKIAVSNSGFRILVKFAVLGAKKKIPDAKKGAEVDIDMPLLKRMMHSV